MQIMNEVCDYLKPGVANLRESHVPDKNNPTKQNLYMEGIFIQGAVQNQNGRTYPPNEIRRAVDDMNARIRENGPIAGEADHPDNLNQNIDRVSHIITEMKMQGNDGIGKLKVLESMPMGKLVRTLVDEGVKLGVSSRGSGDVNESNGEVQNFGIVTVDVVINPSAPNAFPRTIFEQMMNMRGGQKLFGMVSDAAYDSKNQKAEQALLESTELGRLLSEINKIDVTI